MNQRVITPHGLVPPSGGPIHDSRAVNIITSGCRFINADCRPFGHLPRGRRRADGPCWRAEPARGPAWACCPHPSSGQDEARLAGMAFETLLSWLDWSWSGHRDRVGRPPNHHRAGLEHPPPGPTRPARSGRPGRRVTLVVVLSLMVRAGHPRCPARLGSGHPESIGFPRWRERLSACSACHFA